MALDGERSEVLRQLEDWLEVPMLVLGFVWLALLVVEFIWGKKRIWPESGPYGSCGLR